MTTATQAMARGQMEDHGTVTARTGGPLRLLFNWELKMPIIKAGKIPGQPSTRHVKFERKQERMHRAITALPIILVNSVAIFGQYGWAHSHLTAWHMPGQIMFAVALESIALFYAYHAYLTEQAQDSVLRLKLAAYGFGALVAAINYSHWAPGWKPNGEAVTVALMSASSPWLWATYSRRVSRRAAIGQGLAEPRALRLGLTRWTWHPVRSFRVMRAATWSGERVAATAIRQYEQAGGGFKPLPVSGNGHMDTAKAGERGPITARGGN
jgi:hypothetical protein